MNFTKKGDVYIFDDKHKLMCGDSTDKENYLFLFKTTDLKNVENVMLYTDPPYNASFNGRSGDFGVIKNDDMSDDDFKEFIYKWYECTKLFNFKASYIFCNNYLKGVVEQIDPKKWLVKNKRPIIWVKNNFGMGNNYRPKYEMLMYDGDIDNTIKNECDVWNISKDNVECYIHPTQKPLDCFVRGMNNHSLITNVLDTFAGSGSSLIASIITKKIWYGFELDELYCDKIVRRYYDYTLTENIKLIRNGVEYGFEYIKENLKLLNGASKKGEVNDNQARLF